MTFVLINSLLMLICILCMAVGAWKSAGFLVVMAAVMSVAYIVYGATWGERK